MSLSVGSVAPDFSLPDQNGQVHSLSQYIGKWVILYFYPKDDTTGCTKEACSFRDAFEEYTKKGLVILGISADTVRKHKKFIEKYELPFALLSDTEKEVVNKYEVWTKKKFMGREYMGIVRTTFLINPTGEIVEIFDNIDVSRHAQDVLLSSSLSI
jgi:thioredoxin-dependent peroxiredoxin